MFIIFFGKRMKINWNLVCTRKQIEAEAALKIWPRFTPEILTLFATTTIYCSSFEPPEQSRLAVVLDRDELWMCHNESRPNFHLVA